MADPLSTVASALTVIAGAAKVCESVHSLIRSVRSAPSNIDRLAYELQSTATVLHTLHHTLIVGNEKVDPSTYQPNQRMVGHIFDLVFYTQKVLDNVSGVLEPFTRDRKEGWKNQRQIGRMKALLWEFSKKNEVVALSRTLESYKMTLNLACSSLQMFNDCQTHGMIQRLQVDVSSLLGLINSNSEDQFRRKQSSRRLSSVSEIDVQVERYTLPLQRFLERTSSVISLASDDFDTSIPEIASDTRSEYDSAHDSQQLYHGASGDCQGLHVLTMFQRGSSAAVEIDSAPFRAELESPSVTLELDTSDDAGMTRAESVSIRHGSECSLRPQKGESSKRPLSFIEGREDILDLRRPASASPETNPIPCSLSSAEVSENCSDDLPGRENPQPEKCRTPIHSYSLNDTSTRQKDPEPQESPTPTDEVSESKPKLMLVIPGAATSNQINHPCPGPVHSPPSPVVSPLSPAAKKETMLPPLDLGAMDISPVECSSSANRLGTPSSTSTSRLPELDLGPDVTPEDPNAPWSPSWNNSNPFSFDFTTTKYGAVDERWELFGKERDIFVRYDALSPLVVEKWL